MSRPLILLSNDDSVNASGLDALITMLSPFGDLLVVAPDVPRSGASHSLTVPNPITIDKIRESEGLSVYACSGTPTDCVKVATSCLISRQPDLMVSGINHGSNASVSVIYSGTMGAAIEATMLGIPSAGFSLCDYALDADFSASIRYGQIIIREILTNGIPKGVALNVNIPSLPFDEIKGIKICRQNKGMWKEEFEKKTDPLTGDESYWLSGYYHNEEPGAEGADETALSKGYISIVPTHYDFTAYDAIEKMRKFETLKRD
ncbi:MAG: 5'/3'-nucleotidase SurE [Prevotellaceae bacterium]|jgi:5'-nucleotidase|nr:5'/3'-nucleotidase SurE [Prevotellaceae bacterium]